VSNDVGFLAAVSLVDGSVKPERIEVVARYSAALGDDEPKGFAPIA
jgi:hypothetical protein